MQEANEVVRDHSHISSYDPEQFENVSEISGICTDKLLTSAMESESLDNLSVVIITFNNFTSYLHNIMQFITNQPTLAKDTDVYNGRNSNQRNFLPKQVNNKVMPNIGSSITMPSKRYGNDGREHVESGETNFESEYQASTMQPKHTRNGPAKSISTDQRSFHH